MLYKGNNDRNQILKWESSSNPGIEFSVPSRLGYGVRIKVRSASYRVHVEPTDNGQGQTFMTIDPAAAEHELVVQSLLDPRSFHNITVEDQFGNEQPLRMDRYWIDNTLDERDGMEFGQFLMAHFQEDIGFELTDTSAEGNDEDKEESEKKPPANKGGLRGREASRQTLAATESS